MYQSAKVDFVVSALGLPDMGGPELIAKIQAIRKVPALALSGYGMERDVQRAREADFDAHLTKPVDMGQVLQALKKLAGG